MNINEKAVEAAREALSEYVDSLGFGNPLDGVGAALEAAAPFIAAQALRDAAEDLDTDDSTKPEFHMYDDGYVDWLKGRASHIEEEL